ncbi:MAG: AraC family transcriptional regulator [Porticoccaceae bacterium]|nr:AraC family transcriptional regulator [Porticoccaceae bacterium]
MTNIKTPLSPTIAISYSRMIARQLGLQEKDLAVLLRGTNLKVEDLLNDDTLIYKEQQLQIMRNAMALSGDPGFGLRLGQALTPPTHGPLGFLANSSPNLGTAIRDFQNFLPARVSFTHLRVMEKNGWLECHFDIDISDKEDSRSVLECFALSLLSLIEFVLGRPFTEGHLYCSYAKPEYFADYEKYISCPITFGARESKLLIPESLRHIPNASSDHMNYGFALHQCQSMLQQLDANQGYTSKRIRKLLLSHPPGKLSEEAAAKILFISKRTLARRLAREGSGFQRLRDEILSSLATGYLRDTKLSVEAIAGMLNYHDSSSLRRAFKRWFQTTPERYRKQFANASVSLANPRSGTHTD